MSSPEHVSLFTQANLHIMMIVNQMSLAFFVIASKPSFLYLHPVVFASIRLLICTLSLIPCVLIVDRDFIYAYRKSDQPRTWRNKLREKLPDWKDLGALVATGVALTINQTVCIIIEF
jgi:hypothetical protein